ncbi:MAG: hypothetical protein P4L48_11095 [Mycobacterium sp.]|nr:hypothetical protein [Mycobacterium sp.]
MSLTLSPLMEGRGPDSVLADYRSFYFDTAVATAPETIAGLLAFADPARIVFGTDFPVHPARRGHVLRRAARRIPTG